jgi:CBS domain containing-hemolysin-like protein
MMHVDIEIIEFHNPHVISYNEFMLLRDQIVYENIYLYIHISYPIESCSHIMVILANLVKYMGQIFQFFIWLTSNIVHLIFQTEQMTNNEMFEG